MYPNWLRHRCADLCCLSGVFRRTVIICRPTCLSASLPLSLIASLTFSFHLFLSLLSSLPFSLLVCCSPFLPLPPSVSSYLIQSLALFFALSSIFLFIHNLSNERTHRLLHSYHCLCIHVYSHVVVAGSVRNQSSASSKTMSHNVRRLQDSVNMHLNHYEKELFLDALNEFHTHRDTWGFVEVLRTLLNTPAKQQLVRLLKRSLNCYGLCYCLPSVRNQPTLFYRVFLTLVLFMSSKSAYVGC